MVQKKNQRRQSRLPGIAALCAVTNFDIGSLVIGSPVSVDVWPAKNGDKLATCRTLTTSDGKTYGMAGNSPGMDWFKSQNPFAAVAFYWAHLGLGLAQMPRDRGLNL